MTHGLPSRLLRRAVPALGAIFAVGVALAVPAGYTETKIVNPDAVNFSEFGHRVAISGDTAVVGAANDDNGAGSKSGSAYVFVRTGSGWQKQAKLTPGDPGADLLFGYDVAIDGGTIVVGSFKNGGGYPGSAYVFRRSVEGESVSWQEEAKLLPLVADPSGGFFGMDVDVSGDTVVVGAFYEFDSNILRGAAHVYQRTEAGAWPEQQELNAPDAFAGNFGAAVAIDGDTLVVSAPLDIEGADAAGACYVFKRASGVWDTGTKLLARDGAKDDYLGTAVAIDGSTIVAASGAGGGAVYVFSPAQNGWNQTKVDCPKVTRVAVSGSRIVAGSAEYVVPPAPRYGAARVYVPLGSAWILLATLTASDQFPLQQFGRSVAIDGDRIFVGAQQNSSTGAAYVYDAPAVGGDLTVRSYLLPSSVKFKASADPAKSGISISGAFDLGPTAPDLTAAATLDVGGLHADVPGLLAKGRSFTYAGGGFQFSVTPLTTGSSRGTFKLSYRGDLAGKVAADGPVAIRFRNAQFDAGADVSVSAGKFKLGEVVGSVSEPAVFLKSASAGVKAAGTDTLSVVLGFAGDGVAPPEPTDFVVTFGGSVVVSIPKSDFQRKGSTDSFSGDAGGITSVAIDYAASEVRIAGKSVEVGGFAAGANTVAIGVAFGGRTYSVEVRMGLKGAKLTY